MFCKMVIATTLGLFFVVSHAVEPVKPVHIRADKEKIIYHPTPAEQKRAEENCKRNPDLMGCGDPYYY